MKVDNATDNTTTTLTNDKADLLKHLRGQAQQAHMHYGHWQRRRNLMFITVNPC
jgi:hypothetical protein